jgi:hypothetical protein
VGKEEVLYGVFFWVVHAGVGEHFGSVVGDFGVYF